MPTPRSQQIDLEATPFYHIVSRCVRRSFLCGVDEYSGKNYEHRKIWISERVKFLNTIFTIDTCVHTPMSNHYHLVAHVDSHRTKELTDDEIIERWGKLCPPSKEELYDLQQSYVNHPKYKEKIEIIRKKLSCLSTYIQFLNQHIARLANKEDDVTGRFWEGRFKSQALLDEGALLSAMVYVDLNPVRAKMAETPEDSDFTSFQERFYFAIEQYFKKNKSSCLSKKSARVDNKTCHKPFSKSNPFMKVDEPEFYALCDSLQQLDHLMPFQSSAINQEGAPFINFTLSDYICLVDETSRIVREDKRGYVSSKMAPILERLNLTQSGWFTMVSQIEERFSFAVGSPFHLSHFNHSNRKRSLRGSQSARQCYLH